MEFSDLLCAQRTLKNDKLVGNLFISRRRNELTPLVTSMPISLSTDNLKDPMTKPKIKDVISKCVSNYYKCTGQNGECIRYNSITVEVMSDLMYEILANSRAIISDIELKDGFISQGAGIGKSIVVLMDNIIDTFESDSYRPGKYKFNSIDIKHKWVFNDGRDIKHSEPVIEDKIELNIEVRLIRSNGKTETVSLSSICTSVASFKERSK